ncbi:MAG: hypothetical protein ACKVP0_19380 [Pirellulaceae bacterium]
MLRSSLFAFVAAIALVFATQVSAQVAVQGGGAGGARYGYSQSSQSLMYLLYYPQLQKEIDMVEDQKAELQKIQTESQTKMTEAYKTMSEKQESDPQVRQQKYMELYQSLTKETEEKVAKVLLPHQKKRLNQIMLQMKLSQSSYGYGFAGALEGDDVGKELGITEAQRAELKKKEEKVRADYMKKYQEFYKKLNEETREEMMSVLTPAQRKKLEELLGNKFEWQQAQPVQPVLKPDKKGD